MAGLASTDPGILTFLFHVTAFRRRMMMMMMVIIITTAMCSSSSEAARPWPCEFEGFQDGFSPCSSDSDGSWTPFNVVNVDWHGAKGDGVTDDTQAFMDAWNETCSSESSVLMIPVNKTYLVNHLELRGPCASSVVVEVAGTLLAPSEPSALNNSHGNAWILFSYINGLTVEGGGTLDGRGQQWWDLSCKRNKSNKCKDAPTTLRFSYVTNLKVSDLMSRDSPQVHLIFSNCYGVDVANVQVQAPEDSPNTDGIHIAATQNVLVRNSSMGTGDDCVSIVSGSADIRLENITCGPGHGISVGSLGKGGSNDFVSVVVVDGAVLTGTANGVRIKTWADGAGAAVGMIFENIQMINVSHPIIIDQRYCDSASPSSCHTNETSAVRISQVYYRNIRGTSATKQAIKLQCSQVSPCTNLLFEDVDLVWDMGSANSTTFCENAQGFLMGSVFPYVDCLPPLPEADEGNAARLARYS
ncbi:hypothetical protein KP509_38G004300 [Ceratopteris richardii]|uniref:endo-polygalacturonase n=1 Tax=Ceratopteris richardii TaxID=49495 RepID=A0A8T2Q233_CERRI|nr:hypothetical protein KP509_38G004300 [Ceratopteris richardii]